jgi:crotonobetainyl-CoA:carnitine CoA-transferase CaiB-like acyl-CoA transferase
VPVQTGNDMPNSTLYGVFRAQDGDLTVTPVASELGQHNTEIAAGLGFDADAISAMRADGVLYSS